VVSLCDRVLLVLWYKNVLGKPLSETTVKK
jgi:hypothetical protein